MTMQTMETRRERVAHRGLARSALYRLLSQSLVYPSPEAVDALAQEDLPSARQAAQRLPPEVAPQLAALGEHLQSADAAWLQGEHRRIFSHILSLDCPPCETAYTARHIFQETQELADIGGFLRAFGLKLAERERLDHISVELEFMQFLTFKEAYALLNHGPGRARLCRQAQRKFMRDHLGRWALQFAQRLGRKAAGGFFGAAALLTEAFVSAEIDFLRARPEIVFVDPDWRTEAVGDVGCPAVEECPLVESGRDGYQD